MGSRAFEIEGSADEAVGSWLAAKTWASVTHISTDVSHFIASHAVHCKQGRLSSPLAWNRWGSIDLRLSRGFQHSHDGLFPYFNFG